MKKLLVLAACAVLAGCDYTVPLANIPGLEIDSGLVGLWQSAKDDGQMESLLVLPLNKKEYMVSFPAGSKDAMYAKAWLCRSASMTFVQLEWIGTAQGKLPEDRRVFQLAGYSILGDTLTARLVNADVVKNDMKSTEELAKAIAENKGKPAFFKEKMVFTRAGK